MSAQTVNIVSKVTEQVVVEFRATEGDRSYSDALYFTPAEYAALKPAALDAAMTARFENWKAIVTAPPVERTAEEDQAQLDSLVQQKAALEGQIADLSAKLDSPVISGEADRG